MRSNSFLVPNVDCQMNTTAFPNLSRRAMLQRTAAGFGNLALAAMLAGEAHAPRSATRWRHSPRNSLQGPSASSFSS